MFISICGAQGSGKSFLIEQLKKDQPGIQVIQRKTSRSILDEWRVSLREIKACINLTMDFQDRLLSRKHNDDQVRHSDNILITERSFTDLFTYALTYVGPYNQHSKWVTNYYDQCVEYNKRYDVVFFLKSGHFDIEDDGVRNTNPFYCDLIQSTMLHFSSRMYDNKTKFIVIDTPNIEERKAIIYDTIQQR